MKSTEIPAETQESIEDIHGDKLYLLVSEDGTMFKAGITSSLEGRIAQLQRAWGNLDLKRSFVVSGNEVRMRSLEKMIHFLYSEYNIQHDAGGDGHTEWFDIDCFDQVIDEVQRVSELKKDADIVITKGVNLPKPTIGDRDVLEQETKSEKRERLIMEMTDFNNDRSEDFRAISESLAPFITHTELTEEHGSLRAKLHFMDLTEQAELILDSIMSAAILHSRNGSSNVISSIHSEPPVNGVSATGAINFQIEYIEKYLSYPESEKAANLILDFINQFKKD